MIWGHGSDGYINLGSGESLTTDDVLYIAAERKRLGKGPLGNVWLRACNTCRDATWLNAWLEISDNVYGFTTITVDGPIQHWDKPVKVAPCPRPWFPWGFDKKKDKKKKKKKGKMPW
jgi:hypothetical protein